MHKVAIIGVLMLAVAACGDDATVTTVSGGVLVGKRSNHVCIVLRCNSIVK